MLETGQHQSQDIKIALDQEHDALLPNRGAGSVEVVEHRALVVHRRLGGVQVLRLPGPEQPTTKADDPSAGVVNREEQSFPEPRHHGPIVPLLAEPGLEQPFLRNAQPGHFLEQPLATRRIAEPQLRRPIEWDLPFDQVAPGALGLGRFAQLAGEPLLGGREGGEERFAWIGPLARGTLRNHDPDLAGTSFTADG